MAIITLNNNSLSNISSLPAGVGGKVLQVVNATDTTELVKTGSSTSDTGLSATITPSSTSSKILIFAHIQGVGKDNDGFAKLKLAKNGVSLYTFEQRGGDTDTQNTNKIGGCSTTYLDSPATTSATTYKVTLTGNGFSYVQTGDSNPTHTMTLMEIAG